MTHAFIGQILGVCRESVTVVAQRLQAAGVIRYSQGHITIVDCAGWKREGQSVMGWYRTSSRGYWSRHGVLLTSGGHGARRAMRWGCVAIEWLEVQQ
jgi:hypothetical protein